MMPNDMSLRANVIRLRTLSPFAVAIHAHSMVS